MERSDEMKCENKVGITKGKDEMYEEYFNIGVKVLIRWTKEEIGDSGWRCGWYSAQVQENSLEDDVIKCCTFWNRNAYIPCVLPSTWLQENLACLNNPMLIRKYCLVYGKSNNTVHTKLHEGGDFNTL